MQILYILIYFYTVILCNHANSMRYIFVILFLNDLDDCYTILKLLLMNFNTKKFQSKHF
jgi:hypothetical protein